MSNTELVSLPSYPYLLCSPSVLMSVTPPSPTPLPYPSPTSDVSHLLHFHDATPPLPVTSDADEDVVDDSPSPPPTSAADGEKRSECEVARILSEEREREEEEEGGEEEKAEEDWEALQFDEEGEEKSGGEDEDYVDKEWNEDERSTHSRDQSLLRRRAASYPSTTPTARGLPPPSPSVAADGGVEVAVSTQATSVSLPVFPRLPSHNPSRRLFIDGENLRRAEALIAAEAMMEEDDIEVPSPPLSSFTAGHYKAKPHRPHPHQNVDSHRFRPLSLSTSSSAAAARVPSTSLHRGLGTPLFPFEENRRAGGGERKEKRKQDSRDDKKEKRERKEKGSGRSSALTGSAQGRKTPPQPPTPVDVAPPSPLPTAPAVSATSCRRRRPQLLTAPTPEVTALESAVAETTGGGRRPQVDGGQMESTQTSTTASLQPPDRSVWSDDDDDDGGAFVEIVRKNPHRAIQQLTDSHTAVT